MTTVTLTKRNPQIIDFKRVLTAVNNEVKKQNTMEPQTRPLTIAELKKRFESKYPPEMIAVSPELRVIQLYIKHQLERGPAGDFIHVPSQYIAAIIWSNLHVDQSEAFYNKTVKQ
jgi:hypothetical protein